jgi:CheY-like chemotaxis protein/HD-like signal output (HDOD) protein
MACILLADESEVARRAMRGILARGGHRLAVVATLAEAWAFIRQHVRVDLVFTELKLGQDSGLTLVERMKRDNVLKLLPVVIYTGHGNRDAVRQALDLRVQNFLMKPYHEDVIHAEMAKATANPWRARHFEEERTFCKLMGYEPAQLRRMLEELPVALAGVRPALEQAATGRTLGAAGARLDELAEAAESAGAWGLVEFIGELRQKAAAGDWNGYNEKLEGLELAGRLIAGHLDQEAIPEAFLSEQEKNAGHEERERQRWLAAPAEGRCPVVDFAALQRELDALSGCPVADSAAANFEMSATGHPSSLNPLMGLADKDPGLAVQLLISAAQLKRHDALDTTPLEDPRLAVGRLGELRLAQLARSLVILEERRLHLPPHFGWPQFWMFQMGVARMARFVAHYLEFYSMESQAHLAGLMHDLGRLLLMHLHPHGFAAALAWVRGRRVALGEAEQLFFGCTAREVAGHFAEKHGLPEPYAIVMRWVDRPGEAPAHRNLVAVVSLARDLCRHNHVGVCGDAPSEQPVPIGQTPEWAVLGASLYPSFDLRKFELQVHADCRELKLELHGRLKNYAVA